MKGKPTMQIAQEQKMLHARSMILIAILATQFASGCSESDDGSPKPIVSITGQTMGTTYFVKLNQLPAGVTKEALQAEIDRRLEEVNDQMSTWRPDSEISRFNTSDSTDWFEVSTATVSVFKEASRISELSDGAFDVTVSPLVALWGFNRPDGKQAEVPSDETITATKQHVGYQLIVTREKPSALKKNHSQATADLSGIAKGYGVDVVADYLSEKKVSGYMREVANRTTARGRLVSKNRPSRGVHYSKP
jgi:thiamine biosynthesis lipoprotein